MNGLRCVLLPFLLMGAVLAGSHARGATLYVGAASCDITPDRPAFLYGQMATRVSEGVQYPVTANILVLESREGDQSLESAIIISIDTCIVRECLLLPLRKGIQQQLPQFDLGKVIITATQTHAAPSAKDGYFKQQEGVLVPSDYVKSMVSIIGPATKQAWNARRKAKFSYGLGYAVVGRNRRAVYANSRAVMYGKTNAPEFRGFEGMEDHGVDCMFFWDMNDKLVAMIVTVACPPQEVENSRLISSDFWGPTRDLLNKEYGQDVTILGLPGAGGEMSPHLLYRKAADDRMTRLRQLSRLQELARRIFRAVEEVYDVVRDDKQEDVVVKHQYAVVDLPEYVVTEAEYKACKASAERLHATSGDSYLRGNWHARVIARYEKLRTDPRPMLPTDVNVLRIGDTVICTNQFELFIDYGVQIKARSKAVQTFVVQLANGSRNPEPPASASEFEKMAWHYASSNTYLPTERAMKGGGYSANAQSIIVGPEGGQVLVEETVKMINAMF